MHIAVGLYIVYHCVCTDEYDSYYHISGLTLISNRGEGKYRYSVYGIAGKQCCQFSVLVCLIILLDSFLHTPHHTCPEAGVVVLL